MADRLHNYNKFIHEFGLLKKRIESYSNNFSSTSITDYTQFIEPSNLIWINCFHEAANEIDTALQHFNKQRDIDRVNRDHAKFKKWIEDIISANIIIKNAEPLTSQKILGYYKNEDDPNSKILIPYSVIVRAFEDFFNPILKIITPESKTTSNKRTSKELTSKQVAYKNYMNGNVIKNDINAKIEALKYGLVAENSGNRLYQDYTKICYKSNRIGRPDPFKVKTVQNRIDLFKGVLSYLTEEGLEKANKEISTLEEMIDKESDL